MNNIHNFLKTVDYSNYEYQYSVQIMERLQEKRPELNRVVEEIDRIIIANRKVVGGHVDYSLNEIITEKKANLNRLNNVLDGGGDDRSSIIEWGAEIVKLIGVQNTFFTRLQLQMTQESFLRHVTAEHTTTIKYLIDLGRSLLIEIIR
ncbi:hypothetical protein [Halalkalibacter okhensis]|uniref:DUF2383 domain-containing protein n=1 Tax=Halalkalibacter okhensis TaxID=333138 RepID=A0A0B0IFP5_9BACI|nr:hypothetical protein [Halalkalibacter okhensis]KHF41378.1 hypothetical protein LQ50_03860 [Halalkalibacter okhensis]